MVGIFSEIRLLCIVKKFHWVVRVALVESVPRVKKQKANLKMNRLCRVFWDSSKWPGQARKTPNRIHPSSYWWGPLQCWLPCSSSTRSLQDPKSWRPRPLCWASSGLKCPATPAMKDEGAATNFNGGKESPAEGPFLVVCRQVLMENLSHQGLLEVGTSRCPITNTDL